MTHGPKASRRCSAPLSGGDDAGNAERTRSELTHGNAVEQRDAGSNPARSTSWKDYPHDASDDGQMLALRHGHAYEVRDYLDEEFTAEWYLSDGEGVFVHPGDGRRIEVTAVRCGLERAYR